MSIIGSIFDKIFNRDKDRKQDAPANPSAKPTTPATGDTPVGQAPGKVATPVRLDEYDVAAIVEKKVADKGEKLNWQSSIVDLMKALDLDSSLENRKELADELGYTGDKSDSATMNIWLHKQVMKKLAENGGKVPAGLAD